MSTARHSIRNGLPPRRNAPTLGPSTGCSRSAGARRGSS